MIKFIKKLFNVKKIDNVNELEDLTQKIEYMNSRGNTNVKLNKKTKIENLEKLINVNRANHLMEEKDNNSSINIMDEEKQMDFIKELLVTDLDIRDYRKVLNIVNKSDNENPKYESSEAAGFDFRANLDKSITIGSLERTIVPTGLFFDIPTGFELQVRPRSGLAAKNGVTVLNTPGTVDSDYTGEVKIILVNLSKESFTINHGDRIAQGVFNTVSNEKILKFNFVEEIEKITERNESGFGSTGIK